MLPDVSRAEEHGHEHSDHDDEEEHHDDEEEHHDDEEEHHEHEEEHHGWEWAGIVHLEPGSYWWYAGALNGEYADHTMKLLYVNGTSIEAAEESAEEIWEAGGDGSPLESEGLVSKHHQLYQFHFDDDSLVSRYQVNISEGGDYVFFTEHLPTEFESCESGHFFKNSDLVDVEFSAEEAGHDDHGDHDEHDDHEDEEEDGHDDHGHDDHGHGTGADWEWAGAFRVTSGNYTYSAQKVNGEYGHGDSSMRLFFGYSDKVDGKEAIKSLETSAQTAFSSCAYTIDAYAPDSTVLMAPKYDSTAYMLHFDGESPWSMWKLGMEVTQETTVVIFLQHSPYEFEGDSHYLKDSQGNDVEPSAEDPEEDDPEADWGRTLGATFLVALISLAGLLTLVKTLSNLIKVSIPYLSAFASGTLLATAFFLLLGESREYIKVAWPKEVDNVWRWGTVVMSGYALSLIIGGFFSLVTSWKIRQSPPGKVDTKQVAGGAQLAVIPNDEKDIAKQSNPADLESSVEMVDVEQISLLDLSNAHPIAMHIILGDFFHNMADGFLIGAAFKACSTSVGWTVTYSTLAHEFVQELADYFVLVTTGRLSPYQAALGNFISQMGVVFGGIIVCAVDVEDDELGYVLGFGAGIYLYVALSECAPRFMSDPDVNQNWKCFSLAIFSFILGTVLLGLILLDHEHCAAGDGHEGHGH
ncbi:hypothetical protein CYMTET_14228 [Cymbomonas tetramitiformis]|uniref:Uncharacterized protein n=1 Tax=Cymbomonas tetramitiformis TaxID=36881 RepID=A0AAE0LAL0_9CHLO|nr:hypothetical protein CYMTET_14228 [Cymbomonas tetramitiformis]|eukprot:gene12117-14318_t